MTIEKPADGLVMNMDDAERFLEALEREGRSPLTIKRYRRILEQVYAALGEEHVVTADSTAEVVEILRTQGYTSYTTRSVAIVMNNWLKFMGRRDLNVEELPRAVGSETPELTREEYLRLLSAARDAGDMRTYLVVKCFALLGLETQELEYVTLEAVRAGEVDVPGQEELPIPRPLRSELLDFAAERFITSGPLFLAARGGNPLSRAVVARDISALCRAAGIPAERCTVSCLRRLKRSAWDAAVQKLTPAIQREVETQIDREQNAIGWRAAGKR